MNARSKIVVAVSAALAAAGLVTGPAQAADTTTTFTLNAGGLSVSAPLTANLGTDFTAAAGHRRHPALRRRHPPGGRSP